MVRVRVVLARAVEGEQGWMRWGGEGRTEEEEEEDMGGLRGSRDGEGCRRR